MLRRSLALPVAAFVMAGAGCGGVATVRQVAPSRAHAASVPAACSGTVDAALGGIARRIYAQAAAGRNVVGVRARLRQSTRLSAAVRAGDSAATAAALHVLSKAQILRIRVTRGSRVLADLGHVPALAPVRGVIRDAAGRTVGRYVLSVGSVAAIGGITGTITGTRVVMGPHVQATTSFAATAYPSGPTRIGLRIPATAARLCAASPSATRAAVLRTVGRRLFAAESTGVATQRALRHVATDGGFRRAVRDRDPVALRAAIVRFFGQPTLHIVRVRATDASGALIGDVGGPYVLAPASRDVLAADGTRLGRVTLSVQDDAGYIKLMHRFTGADVVLRTPAGIVPGSLRVPPGATTVSYRVRAFPAGPLQVVLGLHGSP
jgi:hypothetical protein